MRGGGLEEAWPRRGCALSNPLESRGSSHFGDWEPLRRDSVYGESICAHRYFSVYVFEYIYLCVALNVCICVNICEPVGI